MAQISSSKMEGFKNMKLDNSFFQRFLRRDNDAPEETQDFDIYLMENSVMPVLLQGLDALSRQVDRNASSESKGGGLGGGSQAPFNPLTWLAQYLLRNHPRHVKDHRTPMYQQFSDLASIERGRRVLLRHRPEIEDEWQALERESKPVDILLLLQRLDDRWHLDGSFVSHMPQDFDKLITLPKGEEELLFADFWRWFEPFIMGNDVLRATAFDEAEARMAAQERQAKVAEEEVRRREKAIQEAHDRRAALEERFETISADMYINDEINRIMNKGAVIQGVEEKDGGPPLRGEHIALLLAVLGLWGCGVAPGAPEDTWGDAALTAWTRWLTERGLNTAGAGEGSGESAAPRVDSASVRLLLNRDSFQEYLHQTYTVRGATIDDAEVYHTVEVKGIIEEEVEVFVEALDEETGEIVQLSCPENQVAEVRRRLAAGTSQGPVLARVDLVSNRITDLLPQMRQLT